MSKPLIFSMPTIQHPSTKHRKDFILDCLFVGVGCSVLYVATTQSFSEGVKQLHKNKDRKQVNKIRQVLAEFKKQRDLLHSMIAYADLRTIEHKTQVLAPKFIQHISMCKDDLCLEYIAVSILKQGLSRKRKTTINQHLKPFGKFLTLTKIINNVKIAKGFGYDKEWEVAKNFVESVRY